MAITKDEIQKEYFIIFLDKEEIEYVISNYHKGKIEDYQMSALLMAICINGMDIDEALSKLPDVNISGIKKIVTQSYYKKKLSMIKG